MKRKVISSILVIWFVQFLIMPIGQAYVFETIKEKSKQTISPGVQHATIKYENSNGTKQVVNELEIDLLNPYTTIDIGLNNPFTTLRRTSKVAELNTYDNHQVVGAVNASYFTSNGPVGLVAINNEIINHGRLGSGVESPTTQPVAFGIGADGKAIVDYYNLEVSFTIDGKTYQLNDINADRYAGYNILYTPIKENTGTNIYGSELVVTGIGQDTTKPKLGDTWQGTVSKVAGYGSGNSAIPKDGFVLSIQNKELSLALANSLGKEVQVHFKINSIWQNAQFILGAGPLLVQNGQKNITMDPTASFLKNRHPRTALMVDKTGTKVKLVTVDGRQTGYSNGSSLTDLSNFLISEGAYHAINLDGGGSTAMVVRQPGQSLAKLVNKPSNGSEIAVSAILQIINEASKGALAYFETNVPKKMTDRETITLKASAGYDEFYNPLDVTTQTVQWTVEGNIGRIENNQFIPTATGVGSISATISGLTIKKAIEVVPFTEVSIIENFQKPSQFFTSAIRGTTNITASQVGMEASRGTKSVLKWSYSMNKEEVGTAASYVSLNHSQYILGLPKQLGMWVYGDKQNHWLRSTIKDINGEEYTINWTNQNGLDWSGWRFVTATIPSNVTYPIKVDKVYLAEPVESYKSNGTIYLADLKAIYVDGYSEAAFTDMDPTNWAGPAITHFGNKGYITGYIDGTFKPANLITREEASIIIARVLGITNTTDAHTFTDLNASSYGYSAILAVNEHKIMTGKSATSFDPTGQLTRAEMAAILQRAFQLKGVASISFKDVPNDWSKPYISTLVANNLVNGFSDGTYRPNQAISRAEFATFIYRVLVK